MLSYSSTINCLVNVACHGNFMDLVVPTFILTRFNRLATPLCSGMEHDSVKYECR